MKKGGDLFNVSMGAHDGAKVCELIGIFLLNLNMIRKKLVHIGTMDCQFLRTVVVRKWIKIKKHLQKVFKNNSLDIIIECNTKVVNYLGVTFNLNDGTY